MNYRIDRRAFLMGSTALMAAAAAGIRPALAQAGNLRLTFWGSQARADLTYKATDLFAKAGGAAIDGEFLAWNDYWPKLATQTAGGNAPDIIQMDYRYIVEYAARNAIAPLDEFVGKALNISDFDQDQVDGGKVNGKLYGVSLGANSVAMAVNTAAFKKAGIDLPGKDTTYDDFPKIGEAFDKAGVGMKAFQDGSGVEPALENWLRQRNKALYTADGKLGFDEKDMTEWFNLWKGFRDAGIIVSPEDQALDTGPLENTMLALGKAASIFTNSNQLVAHQAILKDPLTITNYPRIKPGATGGHYRKPSMFWSVAGGSKNKEEAAKFISFFVNDPEAVKALGIERGVDASKAAREIVAPMLDALNKVSLDFVGNLGDLVGPIPPTPPTAAGEIDISLLLSTSQEVAFGQSSPEDAGPAFVKAANEILARSATK
ncbi:MAG TPA: extracellular solute-binding protein [Devosiaceae bacterium]|jgi:multiple sugar transport system substrate-binding protein